MKKGMPSLLLSLLRVMSLGWALTTGRGFLASCTTSRPIDRATVPPGTWRRLAPTPESLDPPSHDDTNTTTTSSTTTTPVVSDAEALLACYSFLKRRKRMGRWESQELRQRQQASAPPHFFWEDDLSKLVARRENELEHHQQGDEEEEEIEYDEEWEEETPLRPPRSSSAAEVWSGEFTSFPTGPSPSWTRWSQSSKKRWMDPDFREHWYQQRWGEHMAQKDEAFLEEQELEQQIRALPSGFLGSPELSEMTDKEISQAIQSYLTTKQKRVASRQKTLQERKARLQKQMEEVTSGVPPVREEEPLSRDSLFRQDEATLREAQRKRSERAKQLYQTRVENRKRRQTKASSKPFQEAPRKFQPRRATPQDAMIRIQRHLENATLPSLEDVEIIVQVKRMAKRRDVFRQILADGFDLRGKCVPTNRCNDTDRQAFEFVTQCSIDDLGTFVVTLMRQKIKGEAGKTSNR